MADNTIIQQGRFTADGNAKVIKLRNGVDWMKIWNTTTIAAGGAGTGVIFEWQRGLATDYAIEYQKLAADESMVPVIATSGGFTYVDTSADNPLGPINTTISAIDNATPPGVLATSTLGLVEGSIIRLINPVGAQQLGGVDFAIDTIVANTSFNLTYGPTIVAGTTSSFYPVVIPPAFYPKRRFIQAITAANPAVVTTTVPHGYTVGQKVRLQVPSAYGMTQMNELTATVTAVGAASITTDIDGSAFTAFAWPLTAGVPFTHAQVIPVGEAAESTYVNLLDDATIDQGYIGMSLASGTDSPAGAANDVIYWQAGTSFSVNNE